MCEDLRSDGFLANDIFVVETTFDGARAQCTVPRGSHAGSLDVENISAFVDVGDGVEAGWEAGIQIAFVAWQGAADFSADAGEIYAATVDAVVAPFVSTDVLGFLINADAFVGGEYRLVDIAAEGVALNESKATGADAAGSAVVAVPVIAAPVERFGRQWSPAYVVAAGLPANPGGSPFIAGNPAPADVAEQDPATVVVGGPAERLGGDPSPAEIAVCP